jgi:Glycogen recognition site of AMP-activated protein kinase
VCGGNSTVGSNPTATANRSRRASVVSLCLARGDEPTLEAQGPGSPDKGFAMAVSVERGSEQTAFVKFSLPESEDPSNVSVVGSFNDWTPGAHLFTEDQGEWSVIIEVPYGHEVHFRYLGDGGRWFDDPDAEPAGDEGGRIAAVVPGDEDSAVPEVVGGAPHGPAHDPDDEVSTTGEREPEPETGPAGAGGPGTGATKPVTEPPGGRTDEALTENFTGAQEAAPRPGEDEDTSGAG